MNKSIKLTGLSSNPSDYECNDGGLSSAINVTHDINSIESGSITCAKLVSAAGDNVVKHIHKNTGYEHAIVYNSTSKIYYYADKSSISTPILNFNKLQGKECKSITSIGNTLIFSTGDLVYYYLWRFSDNSYSYLGNHIPELHISYGLKREHNVTEFVQTEQYGRCYRLVNLGTNSLEYGTYESYAQMFKCETDDVWLYDKYIVQGNQRKISDAVLAQVKSTVSHYGYEKGRFVFPFLVRHAYRLFDGSLTMASQPVLMITSTDCNPYVILDNIKGEELWYHTECSTFALDYAANAYDKYLLKNNWSDIVKSVEVYVSSPIYTFDTEGLCIKIYEFNQGENVNNCIAQNNGSGAYELLDMTNDRFGQSTVKIVHKTTTDVQFFKTNEDSTIISSYPSYGIELPVISKEDIRKDIETRQLFYNIKTIEIEDISTTRANIDISKGVLEPDSLRTREVLTEDYQSHDTIVPGYSNVYNYRVNEALIKRRLFGHRNEDGTNTSFYPECSYPYQSYSGSNYNRIQYKVLIRENDGDIVVSTIKDKIPYGLNVPFFFYPNPNAIRLDMVFCNQDGTVVNTKRLKLRRHSNLDGAYVCCEFPDTSIEETDNNISTETNNLVETDIDYTISNNEVYTSEVGNPFVFKAINVETIGSGKLISMVPQAIALSQGQFGEYPMMCFTTDGIWALSVNQTGGWAAKQPFSRDVVLREDAGNILQLDRQIMFASNRGLMLINGSNVECISEVFDGNKDSFSVRSTSSVDGYKFIYDNVISNSSNSNILSGRPDLTKDNINFDFKEFISDATFLYDYTHQRIIVGNKSYPFAYIYNMKDRYWTSINQCITSSVNSYPNCYAMTKVKVNGTYTNLLVDFSATDGVASEVGLPTDGFVMTRPLKLDAPDVLKTITEVNARGVFSRNNVDVILFGSRDMTNWFVLGSSKGSRLLLRHGSPFKFFRVGLITHLADGESLESIDVEYELKKTNKIR